MYSSQVNPLPVINDWLNDSILAREEFSQKHPTAVDLSTWIKDRYKSQYSEEERALLVDCLIAAGIGREPEQSKTIYCRCSY